MRQYLLRGLAIGLLPVTLITGCSGDTKQTQRPQSKEEAIVWNVDDAMHSYMKENYGDRGETAYGFDVAGNVMEYSLPVETRSGRPVFVYRSDSIFARVYLGSQDEPVKIDCDGCTRFGIEKVTIPRAKEKFGEAKDKLEEIKKKAEKAGEKIQKKVEESAKTPKKDKPYGNR